jgi:hypothetical protein
MSNVGALSPQANEAEEMSSKPISGPANVIANVAGALKSVPPISGLATTTEAAAKMVASTAQSLGFSKPASLEPVNKMVPATVGNMTNTNTIDTAVKLTYDAKAETTIDSAAVGVKTAPDEMNILKIAQHESYITQFEWPVDAPNNKLLWNTHVHPTCSQLVGNYPGRQVLMTAMAGAAFPFTFWRGTIKYRFQVVGTSFHRGRLKISWDPYPTTGKSESNVQYTHIVDIGETKDFTIDVGWGSGTAYNTVGKTPAPVGISTPISQELHGMANGILQVHVANQLTIPYTVDPIKILVSVSAGDDFEVAAPAMDKLLEYSYFPPTGPPDIVMPSNLIPEEEPPATVDVPMEPLEPQSGDVEDNTEETAAPEKSNDAPLEHFAAPTNNSNAFQLVHFGDPVTSLRQILKRYEHYCSDCWADKSITRTLVKVDTILPRPRGYCGLLESMDSDNSGKTYNYTINNAFTWFTPTFLAMRGGIRRKFIYDGPTLYSIASVARESDPDADVVRVAINSGDEANDTTMSYMATGRVAPLTNGGVTQDLSVNKSLEVEFPFHSNYRFFVPRRLAQRSSLGTWDNPKYLAAFPSSNRMSMVHEFIAAGDDLSLHWFQGMPMLWEYPNPSPIPVTQATSALENEGTTGDPSVTV